MLSQDSPADSSAAGIAPVLAAEVQDELLVTHGDLDRLQRLLGSASDSLLVHFYGATEQLNALLDAGKPPSAEAERLRLALEHMAGAITAMQFQDMASQLIEHSTKRLRRCADRIASDALGDDEDGAAVVADAPMRPNPVTQDEIDAGSIELF
jgi:hypothetical protein